MFAMMGPLAHWTPSVELIQEVYLAMSSGGMLNSETWAYWHRRPLAQLFQTAMKLNQGVGVMPGGGEIRRPSTAVMKPFNGSLPVEGLVVLRLDPLDPVDVPFEGLFPVGGSVLRLVSWRSCFLLEERRCGQVLGLLWKGPRDF